MTHLYITYNFKQTVLIFQFNNFVSCYTLILCLECDVCFVYRKVSRSVVFAGRLRKPMGNLASYIDCYIQNPEIKKLFKIRFKT